MEPQKKDLRNITLIEAAEKYSLSEILMQLAKIYQYQFNEYQSAKWSKKLAKIFRSQFLYK